MKILSPMPRGSGAIVAHRVLERHLPGYRVMDYSPWWTLFPPALCAVTRGSADLIHTTPDYALFSTQRHVPYVLTFQNYVLDPFMRAYSSRLQWMHYRTDLRLFTQLALNRASAITAVSKSTAELVASDIGSPLPIRVIPNGVDISRFSPPRTRSGRQTIRVLFSGNLTRRKGAHLLPGIAARLPSHIEIVCASGLGRGNVDIGSLPNFKILKGVSHEAMPKLYHDVDILLMPTTREGMSLAVLEAMASALPVVASNCSSLPEQVDPGKGGYLCKPDDVAAFADAVVHLAESAAIRRQMGEYNRARVEKEFDARMIAAAYRALFEEVLDKRNRVIAN